MRSIEEKVEQLSHMGEYQSYLDNFVSRDCRFDGDNALDSIGQLHKALEYYEKIKGTSCYWRKKNSWEPVLEERHASAVSALPLYASEFERSVQSQDLESALSIAYLYSKVCLLQAQEMPAHSRFIFMIGKHLGHVPAQITSLRERYHASSTITELAQIKQEYHTLQHEYSETLRKEVSIFEDKDKHPAFYKLVPLQEISQEMNTMGKEMVQLKQRILEHNRKLQSNHTNGGAAKMTLDGITPNLARILYLQQAINDYYSLLSAQPTVHTKDQHTPLADTNAATCNAPNSGSQEMAYQVSREYSSMKEYQEEKSKAENRSKEEKISEDGKRIKEPMITREHIVSPKFGDIGARCASNSDDKNQQANNVHSSIQTKHTYDGTANFFDIEDFMQSYVDTHRIPPNFSDVHRVISGKDSAGKLLPISYQDRISRACQGILQEKQLGAEEKEYVHHVLEGITRDLVQGYLGFKMRLESLGRTKERKHSSLQVLLAEAVAHLGLTR